MYLFTGYEPFGDHDTNPSATLAGTFDGRRVAGHEVVGEVLPVVFADAAAEMAALLDEHNP
ncbi:peptidase, partial [Natronomonas sp. CBA1123]|nr:peptidase [Natronomonas sp. CBA1123]